MSRNHKIALLFGSLLICFSLSGVASAQVVDPCQYGCPKSGCPQCPEGGPIKSNGERKAGGDHQNPGDLEKNKQKSQDKEEKGERRSAPTERPVL